jgi:hypothetical protein
MAAGHISCCSEGFTRLGKPAPALLLCCVLLLLCEDSAGGQCSYSLVQLKLSQNLKSKAATARAASKQRRCERFGCVSAT